MSQSPNDTYPSNDDEQIPIGTVTTIAGIADAPARENRRPVFNWRNVSARIRSPLRRKRTKTTGMTLVGGDMLPLLTSMSTLSTTLEDIVQPEGLATPHDIPSQIAIWLFQPDRDPVAIGLDTLPTYLNQEKSFIWIDISQYNQNDLKKIGTALGLHRQVLSTIMSPWHRPSLAVFPDIMYLSATVAHLDAAQYVVQASELDLCLGQHFLLSAHKRDLPFSNRIIARTQQTPDLVQSDPAFLLYLFLDELLAYYEEINRHIQVESEQIEEQALRDSSDTFLEDLLRFKRYAFAVSQLVDQHREVFAAFFRPDFHWVSGDDVEGYFRDLQSRLAHLLGMLLVAKEAVNSAFSIYVSQMSHRTNQIIKVLTMVSTLLLPATLIIALFGESIHSLLPNYQSFAFGIMLISVIAISIGTLYLFARQNWISFSSHNKQKI